MSLFAWDMSLFARDMSLFARDTYFFTKNKYPAAIYIYPAAINNTLFPGNIPLLTWDFQSGLCLSYIVRKKELAAGRYASPYYKGDFRELDFSRIEGEGKAEFTMGKKSSSFSF
jgi:hypothetical protein